MTDRWLFTLGFVIVSAALGLLTLHVTQALLFDVADAQNVSPVWHELATLFVAGP